MTVIDAALQRGKPKLTDSSRYMYPKAKGVPTKMGLQYIGGRTLFAITFTLVLWTVATLVALLKNQTTCLTSSAQETMQTGTHTCQTNEGGHRNV